MPTIILLNLLPVKEILRKLAPWIITRGNPYNNIMGVTRLKRKERKNRAVANNRTSRIKQLTKVPVIKNVDVEAIKKSFETVA